MFVVMKKVERSSRVSRKSGGHNGAYVDDGPCTARGDGEWNRSRLLQWLDHRDNVELIFLFPSSRQPDNSYTQPWRR